MQTLLALLVALAMTPSMRSQTETFISGTVTDDTNRPIAGAIVGAGASGGVTDAAGRFSIGAVSGTTILKVTARGFLALTKEVTVPSDRPLYGLEISLTQSDSPSLGSDVFSGQAVRAIVQQAVEEWGPRHQNVVLSMETQVRERWPTTMELPIPVAATDAMELSIPVAATDAIDIYVAPPYAFYRTAIAEAIRKMEPPVDVAYPASVAIVVSPKQIDAPDIEKIVVERDGEIIAPSENALQPSVMTSRLGVETVVHTGFVAYPLSAFAPGATVRITAIPRTGSNFVLMLDEATLLKVR